MSTDDTLRQLLTEVERTRASLENSDSATDRKLADVRRELTRLEKSFNTLAVRNGRPSYGETSADAERASAIELLEQKSAMRAPKSDVSADEPGSFSSQQIDEAAVAIKAMRNLMKCTDFKQLPMEQQKALSAFNMGSFGFLMAPEMSQTILSCLEEPTDIAGLMENVQISAGSIKFTIDNAEAPVAGWACDLQCWANAPSSAIAAGLGEIEIKAESLRHVECVSRDLLEDATASVENWLLQKVNRQFAGIISDAIVSGDGIGKPLGILRAGIPIVETNTPPTPAGQFVWQDLVMLKYQVPATFQGPGTAYLMNQNTFGLMLTMSDAMGRPIMTASPVSAWSRSLRPILLSPIVSACSLPCRG